jgi:hypothetical protein
MTFDQALRAHVLDDKMDLRSPILLVWTHVFNNESIAAATEIAKLAMMT